MDTKVMQVTTKAQGLGHNIWICRILLAADSERLIYCSRCGAYCHHRAQGLVQKACSATKPHIAILRRIKEGKHPTLKLFLAGHHRMPASLGMAWDMPRSEEMLQAQESRPVVLQWGDPPALGVVVFDQAELQTLEGSWCDFEEQQDDQEDLAEAMAFSEGLWGSNIGGLPGGTKPLQMPSQEGTLGTGLPLSGRILESLGAPVLQGQQVE